MIIVKGIGGLGNQMFQYAVGRCLAIRRQAPLKLDISGFSKFNNTTILDGDRADLLPRILAMTKTPCIFWLDAHYSTEITATRSLETPIAKEVQHLLRHPIRNQVVLIDDARAFTGQHDYPRLEDLRLLVLASRPELKFKVQDDIIRIHHQTDGTHS